MDNPTNKTALITGASSGIGEAFARIHAQEGGHVVLVARRVERLLTLKAELEKQFPIRATVVEADLLKPDSANILFDQLKQDKIQIDYLINNAGIGGHGTFNAIPLQKHLEIIQLNIESLTKLTHLFLEDFMIRKEGRILNVGSTAGFLPGPRMAVYYASKAYVLSFTEALHEELKHTNISATALCPGPTRTEFAEKGNMHSVAVFKSRFLASSLDVAWTGYQAMLKGKAVAVHGVLMKITMLGLLRFIPRFMARGLSGKALREIA